MVSYRVGGREYPLKTMPRCPVCMSVFRFDIEEEIVKGRTYARIHREVISRCEAQGMDVSEAPPRISISNHYNNGHMPLEFSQQRQIVEDRARQVGKRVEEGLDQIVDGITLMETVVLKSFEAIAQGRIEPTVRDGLAASKLLAELGVYDGSDVDQQAYVNAFMAYHETAERIMSSEEFSRFGDALATNPVLKSLAARYEGEPDVVEGQAEEVSARDS